MSADFGVVADSWAGGIVEPDELGPLTCVRLTGHPSVSIEGDVQRALREYAARLLAARIQIALVLPAESFPTGLSRAQRRRLMHAYIDAVQPRWLIVGNEMDVDMRLPRAERASSWGMTPERYLPLWLDALEATRGTATIPVVGGLIGQTEDWYERFLALLDQRGVSHPSHTDVHLYGDTADTVDATIQRWRDRGVETPIVAEWNLPEHAALEGRGNYTRMVRALAAADIEMAAYFCWSDAMVQGLGFREYPWVVEEVFNGVRAFG